MTRIRKPQGENPAVQTPGLRPVKSDDVLSNAKKHMAAERGAADIARYEALARKHGADLSEEGFNEALARVSQRKTDQNL